MPGKTTHSLNIHNDLSHAFYKTENIVLNLIT